MHDPLSPKARKQYLKATRNRDASIEKNWTAFRTVEKRYKSRLLSPSDLSNVLDLALLDEPARSDVIEGGWSGRSDAVTTNDLYPSTDASVKAYSVPQVPGLVVLPAFLTPEEQKTCVKWALSEQTASNETNLHAHYNLPSCGIWEAYEHSTNDPNDDLLIVPKASTSNVQMKVEDERMGPRQLVNNEPASIQTYDSSPKPESIPSSTVPPLKASALLRKLRWTNIGYLYHWGTKSYDFSKGKRQVNPMIGRLCKRAVMSVPWEQVYSVSDPDVGKFEDWRTWGETYEPDAGIVNFYGTTDSLMAHVDRSELCATSPLVSISLGNAGIFLIGGITRDIEPIPILLRSGDCVIMSGPHCRRAYHGVPRILEGTIPSYLSFGADESWKVYREYLKTVRLNINVRQVFPKGFHPPCDQPTT